MVYNYINDILAALGCPEWSLEVPDGGKKGCSGTVVGQNASGYACQLSCPRLKPGEIGADFVRDPSLYICTFGGSWIPRNTVPDCSGE